jgi:hypothetical protein
MNRTATVPAINQTLTIQLGDGSMAKKKSKPKSKSPFLGRWHIVSMSMWDEAYLNEEVPAFIEFEDKGLLKNNLNKVHAITYSQISPRSAMTRPKCLESKPAIRLPEAGNPGTTVIVILHCVQVIF